MLKRTPRSLSLLSYTNETSKGKVSFCHCTTQHLSQTKTLSPVSFFSQLLAQCIWIYLLSFTPRLPGIPLHFHYLFASKFVWIRVKYRYIGITIDFRWTIKGFFIKNFVTNGISPLVFFLHITNKYRIISMTNDFGWKIHQQLPL